MQKKLSLLLENRTKYHWQPTVCSQYMHILSAYLPHTSYNRHLPAQS